MHSELKHNDWQFFYKKFFYNYMNAIKLSNINQTSSQNNKKEKIKGTASIATGVYLGEKAVTSGLRRALGVRIETHTTKAKTAKKIIKEGKILDPKFGGTGCSRTSEHFLENSKNMYTLQVFIKIGMKF